MSLLKGDCLHPIKFLNQAEDVFMFDLSQTDTLVCLDDHTAQ